ncbi:hypothetical protein QBC39DRAFT_226142, partial [Podospora conica]
QIDRWYCCACARNGHRDPFGMWSPSEIHDTDPSRTTGLLAVTQLRCNRCQHLRCWSCGVGSSWRPGRRIARTVGGVHTSTAAVDPEYWGCMCGEWKRNRFGRHCEMGVTGCANPMGCPGMVKEASMVLNMYGQRLGRADQVFTVIGGPWWWQMRGL